MPDARAIRNAFEKGAGVLRLAPNFVPRRFSQAGRRLRLHPDDYYALGTARGSIKERWFSSVIPAMNGPLAPADEGMSYVAPTDRREDRFLFRDAVAELGAALIGAELHAQYGTWPMYSKFFDYEAAVPPPAPRRRRRAQGRADGQAGGVLLPSPAQQPPRHLSRHLLRLRSRRDKGPGPGAASAYEKGDNRITELSRAYRIELGTGWYTPPGVVHAPARS